MSSEYTLGQPVTFTNVLVRTWAERETFNDPHVKKWVPRPFGGAGIIIGRRTLSNGVNTGLYSDDGISYTATEHFTAYLVVESMNSKPVHVLPEHLAPADGTEPPPTPATTALPGQTEIDLG